MAGSKGSKKRRRDANHSLLAAIGHPLRRKILWLMSDGRTASPSELAETLGEPLSSVAYHVRVLAACGALKAVSNRQVRGATQHFYRWTTLPKWAREALEENEGPFP